MSPTQEAAMKMALEALMAHVIGTSGRMPRTHDAITALRAALAEPVQEPVKRSQDWHDGVIEGHSREREYWLAQQAEPVQEPFALPCPTPKACKAFCCSGNCIPRSMA